MKLLLFRYFLNPTTQQIIFPDEIKNKKELVESLLQREYYFDYQGSKLAYTFERKEGNYISGKIGKKSKIVRNLPPTDGFRKETEDDWPNCSIFISVDEDPETGQMIAFEFKKSVFGEPIKQLLALAKKINIELAIYGYVLNINPITKEQDFWKIIREHKGHIEKLDLTFAAPNLFNLKNKLNDDLREAKEEFGITNTTISLENKDGQLKVPENNPLIKQGIEYITEGGGEFVVKIKGKLRQRIITSEQRIKSKEISINLDLSSSSKEVFNDIVKDIFTKDILKDD